MKKSTFGATLVALALASALHVAAQGQVGQNINIVSGSEN